ncbi:hypothetical protein B0H65DRAFT_113646 [Neurospora tetraspora]|uniref:Uncharacterized protein n=1 Tax=Neurospora tetraspora TaxID=94610 RepID=A0AAE0JKF9_9PEZI|nr:hypothetical protein B0H65DRAFT_113646 [Neurospora tetraspora]
MNIYYYFSGREDVTGGVVRTVLEAHYANPIRLGKSWGTELGAPPEYPIVKNFMMSETRIRKDGSRGSRVACQGSQDSTRSATGIREKSAETKEGIPMMVSGGSRPEENRIVSPGLV